ncbi:MAG: ThuA domain-containing protein [Verrucomicrobia bacterium]|nr:ThuA domain-containing protein [Verrucomicrobiota bacterium]
MRRILLTTLIGLGMMSLAAAPASAADAKPAKIKVLLITGDDVGAHKWREMSEATRDVLVAGGKFDVKVCEDIYILDSANALKNYDLVFLSYYNTKPVNLSDQAKENLLGFVKGGKGFAISHLSSASFAGKDAAGQPVAWDEFRKLAGRYWVMGKSGHGPRSVFKAKIANKDHAITKGLEDFDQDDELYAKLLGDAPINVLVTAESSWSKQTEPLAFTLEYGQGRVFHECFGHDGPAIKNPSVAKLIQRGCEWAATGKVD